VNFYKRYMGDYGKKTAHLSLMEHGAYTLLLDAFYSTEKGLPAGLPELYRICRAMTNPEKAAVSAVADQFFPVNADGLRYNGRASEEMDEAAPAILAAKENGKKGGRPRTKKEPAGFSEGTHGESSSEPKPDSPSLRSGERATSLPKDWKLPGEWRAFCKTERPELDPDKVAAKFADYWRGKGGKEGRKLDWFATWRNWVRDERGQSKGRGDWQESREWHESQSGVEARAKELGIPPWNQMEEHWPTYRQRVMKADKGGSEGFLSVDQLFQMSQERKVA
jgi:uncharacterized protein YdaU (DUF1376 family)